MTDNEWVKTLGLWGLFVIVLITCALVFISREQDYTCRLATAEWAALQQTVQDCMQHPRCYLTPDTLQQIRTLGPQVAECNRAVLAE